MALLARSGDRAGAIRQYRACVAVLERELGVAPLAETTELYEAIRDAAVRGGAVDRARSQAAASTVGSAQPRRATLPVRPPACPWSAATRPSPRSSDAHAAASHRRPQSPSSRARPASASPGSSKRSPSRPRPRGGRVLAARAFAAEGAIAYGPIVELLRVGLAGPGAAARARRRCAADAATRSSGWSPLPAGLGRARDAPAPAATTARGAGDAPDRRGGRRSSSALVAGRHPGPGRRRGRPVGGRRVAARLSCASPAGSADARAPRALRGGPRTSTTGGCRVRGLRSSVVPDARHDRAGRLDRPGRRRPGGGGRGGRRGRRSTRTASLAESEGLPLFVVEALAAGPARRRRTGAPRGVRALLRERLASRERDRRPRCSPRAPSSGARSTSATRARRERPVGGRDRRRARGARAARPRPGGRRRREGRVRLRARPAPRRRLRGDEPRPAPPAAPARRGRASRRCRPAATTPAGSSRSPVHERAAGRDAEAAEAFREAGCLAARRCTPSARRWTHLETALALGHPDVVGHRDAIGEVRTALGDYAGAVAALEAAAAVTRRGWAAGDRAAPRPGPRPSWRPGDRGQPPRRGARGARGGRRPPTGAAWCILVERALVARRARATSTLASRSPRGPSRVADGATTIAAGRSAPRYRCSGLVARERGDLDAARDSLARSLELAAGDPDPGAAIAAAQRAGPRRGGRGRPGRRDRAARGRRSPRAAGRASCTSRPPSRTTSPTSSTRPAGTEEAMAHLKRAVTLFADIGGRPGELEPEIWKLVTW